jgi:protein TonB
MLAYAASRPAIAARSSAPNAMLAIIGLHVAAVAVLMSAKMEFQPPAPDPPIRIDFIKPTKPPPPNPATPDKPQSNPLVTPQPNQPVPPIRLEQDPVVPGGSLAGDPGVLGGGGAVVIPEIPRPAYHNPVRFGPQLATPDSRLKPPYPPSKLLTEEEATLRLKLTIDASGRVVAVEPVGRADSAFLASARRHLLAHWRYKPASEDGRAVASTTVITLRFELDG